MLATPTSGLDGTTAGSALDSRDGTRLDGDDGSRGTVAGGDVTLGDATTGNDASGTDNGVAVSLTDLSDAADGTLDADIVAAAGNRASIVGVNIWHASTRTSAAQRVSDGGREHDAQRASTHQLTQRRQRQSARRALGRQVALTPADLPPAQADVAPAYSRGGAHQAYLQQVVVVCRSAQNDNTNRSYDNVPVVCHTWP
jgi:hypothetical protein